MKVRSGFVSNSSSSSFVVAYRGGKPQLKRKINEAFRIKKPKNYPIKDCDLGDFGQSVLDGLDDSQKYTSEVKFQKEWGEDSDNWFEPETFEKLRGMIKAGFTVQMGEFPDDEEEITTAILCNSEILYEDDELYIQSNMGY